MTAGVEHEIEVLRELLGSEDDPEGRAFVPLAEAHRLNGAHDRALEVLRTGLTSHPDFASAYVVAARVHQDLGESAEAEDALRRVLELDPENVQALAGFARAVAARGDDEDRVRELARTLLSVGAEDEARSVLETLRGEGAEDAAAHAVPEDEDEEGPAPGEGADEAGAPRTRTMAEVYARQGLTGPALDIYRELLARDPEDAELAARVEELEALALQPGTTAASSGAAAPGTPEEADMSIVDYFKRLLAWDPSAEEEAAEPASEPAEAITEDSGVDVDDDLEVLDAKAEAVGTAVERGPEYLAVPVDRLSPDAEAEVDAEAVPDAEPVVDADAGEAPIEVLASETEVEPLEAEEPAEYVVADVEPDETAVPGVEELAPDAVPIESLGPDEDEDAHEDRGPDPDVEVVPVAALAPEAEPVGALAPDTVSVESLAPDAVPVESLAPDAVPVESLAPDAVPIGSLAPDAVPVESLAPDAANRSHS